VAQKIRAAIAGGDHPEKPTTASCNQAKAMKEGGMKERGGETQGFSSGPMPSNPNTRLEVSQRAS